MREELKNLADIFYMKILSPSSPINIKWVHATFNDLGIRDENIEKIAELNAPLSREVWYYSFIKAQEEEKLDVYLNKIVEHTGFEENERLGKYLDTLGLIYKDGEFKRKFFKLVVLVSGRGTNLQAIIDAIEEKKLNARIVAVISNRKKAYALERARKKNIPTYYLPSRKNERREDYDRRLDEIIAPLEPDLIVLAGFMRILSPWFVKKYRLKIINIHPALLPSFAGLYGGNVHRAVIEYGCKVSGCTVHFVDEEVDHGPIIIQKCVEVKGDDTVETLAARVLEKEHESLVEAIKLLSEGKIKIEGRRVIRIS